MNAKVDELKVGDISVVRDFVDVFPEDFSRLPPQRQVEFRIDLVHGATSVAKSPYRLAPLKMPRISKTTSEFARQRGFRYDLVIFCEEHTVRLLEEKLEFHFDVVLELLRKEKLKRESEPKTSKSNVNGLSISVKDKILVLLMRRPSRSTSCQKKMLRDLDQQMEKRADDGKANVVTDALSRKERVKPRRVRAMAMTIQYGDDDDQLRLRWMIYLVVLADTAESVRDTIRIEYCLASSSGWTKSPVLWEEIGDSSLTGLELVQETTDKVVMVKENPKATRDHQKSYADNRSKPLEFERGKLAPRYVGPFEILERIGPIAYRLRLPKEFSGVHDTFHVSNLKKCLADASLHVPLDEIKVDKTLRFVEEPVEIMDRKVKSLKRSSILLVKVRWNSKRGPEFTWEREDYMKSKYPQLFVERADESAS
ncbi:hypothetical protein Tco_0959780 [Tanacetum coccineum]